MLHNYKAHRRSTVNSYSGKAFKLRRPQQGFSSEDSMGTVKHVGQPTLNGNQESRELERLTGALDQTARNRELGGGQRAKLPPRLEGRGPAQ